MRTLPEARVALRSIAEFIGHHRALPRGVVAPAVEPLGAAAAQVGMNVAAVQPLEARQPGT